MSLEETETRTSGAILGTPEFDRVARVYRWAEYLCLGPLLSRTRSRFLDDVADAQYVFALGDGDGRALTRLLARAPTMRALAVDTSAGMLTLLRRRCRFAGERLLTLQASVTALPAELPLRQVDLVTTHFLLDCLSQAEVDSLAKHLAAQVAPGCRWVVSDFGIPARQPWRLFASVYVRALYLAFRLLTRLKAQRLPDVNRALSSAGFRRIHHAEKLKGLLYSQVWQLGPPRS